MKTTRGVIKIIVLLAGITILLVGCLHMHKWVDATCTEPKTCSECGETKGEPLGHDFADATCTEPKKCIRCGEVQGDPLGHNVKDWITTTKPTCTNPGERTGICSVCGKEINETINATGHEASEEWKIIKEASFSTSGKRVKTCTVCGEEVESESFNMTKEEKDAFRPSIEGDHFDCSVDDFIENFKYKNNGAFTFTKFQSDDQSQAYIFQVADRLTCTVLCSKTDEGKLKAILVNSDDYSGTVAVGILIANTIDDYFNPEDKETVGEIAEKLMLGKSVEHDSLVVAPYNSSSGKCIVITSNN